MSNNLMVTPAYLLATPLRTTGRLQFSSNTPPFEHQINVESEEQLNQLLKKAKNPVIITFHAEWCSACKLQDKVWDGLSKQAQSQFQLASVDVKELPNLAQKYNVMSIPTSLLYYNGKYTKRQEGVLNAEELEKWLG